MKLSGFDAPGEWLKGNLHCHSTVSDGHREPRDVAAAYARAEYDFLAITDHYEERWGWELLEPDQLDSELILLRAAELSSSHWADPEIFRSDPDVYWVVAVGLEHAPSPPAGPVEHHGLIAAAHAQGAFIGLVHPGLSRLRDTQVLAMDHIDAVEIHDQGQILWDNRADGWQACEALLRAGRRVTGFAADDNHFDAPWEGFNAWVQVRASRDPRAIVTALKAGDYYSTQGPLICGIEHDAGTLTLEVEPARVVIAEGSDWRRTQRRVGEQLTSATFDLEPFAGGYVRFTIIDSLGHRAWTNPLWLDQASSDG